MKERKHDDNGRLDSAEMEVTAFERNRTYTITHHKAGTRIDTVFTFEPLNIMVWC